MLKIYSKQEIFDLIMQLSSSERNTIIQRWQEQEKQEKTSNFNSLKTLNDEETKVDKIIRILSQLTAEEKKELNQEQTKILAQQEEQIKELNQKTTQMLAKIEKLKLLQKK